MFTTFYLRFIEKMFSLKKYLDIFISFIFMNVLTNKILFYYDCVVNSNPLE